MVPSRAACRNPLPLGLAAFYGGQKEPRPPGETAGSAPCLKYCLEEHSNSVCSLLDDHWIVVEIDLAGRQYPDFLMRTLLFSGSGQDSGGNGATDDGATCGLMPDCGLVVPIGAHAGAALVSRKT